MSNADVELRLGNGNEITKLARDIGASRPGMSRWAAAGLFVVATDSIFSEMLKSGLKGSLSDVMHRVCETLDIARMEDWSFERLRDNHDLPCRFFMKTGWSTTPVVVLVEMGDIGTIDILIMFEGEEET